MQLRHNESMEWISHSPDETQEIGRQLLTHFPDAKLICLQGPLGSGKTCFTKGVGESLHIESKNVKSPTFTTLFEHQGKKRLIHCDFYRQEEVGAFSSEWWREILEEENAIVVVEWAEKIQQHLPQERIEIAFTLLSENERKLHIRLYP